jgi:tyrosine-protein phosphatase SIW14
VDNTTFLASHPATQFVHLPMQGNKEPKMEMDKEMVCRVLEIILDPSNYPVLVHCNKGKHRVGSVVGIVRKLQNWSLTSIFDEYRRFSGNKARIADMEFIELFDGSIQCRSGSKPSWL